MKSLIQSILTILLISKYVESSDSSSESTKISDINLEEYYFPIDDLENTKVYHYVSDETEVKHLYWVLKKSVKNGKTFLITDSYSMNSSGEFKRIEIINEEINEAGSFVKEYTKFQFDKNGNKFEVSAKLQSECVFKWDMNKGEKIIWEFETENKLYPGYITNVEKKREYIKETTIIKFNDKEYDAIVFSDNFKVKQSNSTFNKSIISNFTQTSYYAKGIGMYQYVRKFPDGQVTYTLNKILSKGQWNDLKKKK